MQNTVIMTLIVATLALGACRREEPQYQPLKLGAQASAPGHVSR